MAMDPEIQAKQLRVIGGKRHSGYSQPKSVQAMTVKALLRWKMLIDAELKRRRDEINAALEET